MALQQREGDKPRSYELLLSQFPSVGLRIRLLNNRAENSVLYDQNIKAESDKAGCDIVQSCVFHSQNWKKRGQKSIDPDKMKKKLQI